MERQRKVIAFEDLRCQKYNENEIPPEAVEVSLLFPAASQEEVAAIFKGKFDPKNLYKLHWKAIFTIEDDDEVLLLDRLTKHYPQPMTWSRAFLQYVSILSEFEKFNGLTSPLLSFHSRIMDLSLT